MGRYKTMMIDHDPLADSQSNARTFEFILAMQPLKYFKNVIQVLFVKANAIVFDRDLKITTAGN